MRVLMTLLLLGTSARHGVGRRFGADRARRISCSRRRLHCLPYQSGWRAIRRRPAHADAVRHDLFIKHHARSRDRHRQVER